MSLTSKKLDSMLNMLEDMRDCTSKEYKQFSNALHDSIESLFHIDTDLTKSILDAELDAAIDDAIQNAFIMIEVLKKYTDAKQQEEKDTNKDDDDAPKKVEKPEDWEDSWSEKAYVPSKNDPFASEEDSEDGSDGSVPTFGCEDPFDVGIEDDDKDSESCCGKCHRKEEKRHHHHHRHHHRHHGHHRASNPLKTESAEYAEVDFPNFWDKLLDDMIDPNSAIRSGGFKYKFKALPKGAVRDVGNCPYVKVEETEQGYNIIIEYR
jgi:hypothetical protein